MKGQTENKLAQLLAICENNAQCSSEAKRNLTLEFFTFAAHCLHSSVMVKYMGCLQLLCHTTVVVFSLATLQSVRLEIHLLVNGGKNVYLFTVKRENTCN